MQCKATLFSGMSCMRTVSTGMLLLEFAHTHTHTVHTHTHNTSTKEGSKTYLGAHPSSHTDVDNTHTTQASSAPQQRGSDNKKQHQPL